VARAGYLQRAGQPHELARPLDVHATVGLEDPEHDPRHALGLEDLLMCTSQGASLGPEKRRVEARYTYVDVVLHDVELGVGVAEVATARPHHHEHVELNRLLHLSTPLVGKQGAASHVSAALGGRGGAFGTGGVLGKG
jgi:hypothetical protein